MLRILEGGVRNFSSLLGYEAYHEGLYINSNSYGFILEATPLCGASEEIVNILTGMITDGIGEHTAIQIINWASPKVDDILNTWRNIRKENIYNKIARHRINYYRSQINLRDFRVFISVSIPYKYGNMSQMLGLKEQLKSTLQSCGMGSKEIEADEFIMLLREWINPYAEEDFEVQWDQHNLLKEQLHDYESGIEVLRDKLVVRSRDRETEIRSYSVNSYPQMWAQWNNRDLIGDFYSDSLRIPCPFLSIFTFIYEKEDNNEAYLKSFRATQKASSPISRFIPLVQEIDRDWKFVVDKLKKGQKLVKAFYQVRLYSKNGEIEQNERYLKSLYKTKGWVLARDEYVQMQSYLASFPFMMSEGLAKDLKKLGRFKTMVTWSCANIAPLQGEWKGMKNPKMLLIGRRGQPFFWDPFENENGNYNVAVIGKSGSGKSVFMQELVTALVGAGGQVIVIDDGRSFMSSSQIQGGTFIEFGAEGNICLNPFSIISEEDFERNPDYREEVMLLLNIMVRQMCKAVEKTSDIENAFISEAIREVWRAHKSEARISHVSEYLLKHEEARVRDLGFLLQPYTSKGIYSRFFEGRANIKLDSSLFTFEFDNIKSKPDLQRIILMVLIFLVSEKMFHGGRSRTTSLVIDEAWSLLHGSYVAEFIEGIARRARKYKGNLITGTQSIDDYYRNEAATAAIQNTDWFCLLAQKKESIESMKKSGRIAMDGNMEEGLKSLKMVDKQYAEVMIYGSNIGWAIGRLILDAYSMALYSSKGEDFARLKELQAAGMSLDEAIEIVGGIRQ